MDRVLTWWRSLPTWKKWLVAIPLVAVLVAFLVARLLGGSSSTRKITDAATDAIDSTATAAGDAIKTIEEENLAINDRADGRTDAVVDAAGEPCGQFDSAADLYDDRG